jgi:phage gpG-like protein
MSTLSITITNDLAGMKDLLERLSPRGRYRMNLDIAEELINLTRENFQGGTDPYGSKWTPLKPSTLDTEIRKGKQRRDYGFIPLRVTYTLMNSFNRRLSNQDAAIVSTPVAYAKYHQSDEPRKRLPQRLFFPTNAKGLPESYWIPIREIVEEHLNV